METPRDKSRIIVIHELVIGVVDNQGLPGQVVAWRLIEQPGALDTEVDTAVATMPAIAEHLQTRWLGLASIADD